jgi:hypothetical protein
MTWLKVDDGECMAPWVVQVGNEAYGCYVRLGSYCAQQLTDGVVPQAIAEMIAGDLDQQFASRNLAALEAAGRIARDDDGSFRLPHFLDSNPSRAQVETDRAATRRRQAEWRQRHRRKGADHDQP